MMERVQVLTFYASGIPAPRRCWNLANFAWQGLDSKYFWLSYHYWTLPLYYYKNSHKDIANKWVCLCFSKALFIERASFISLKKKKTGPDLDHRHTLPIPSLEHKLASQCRKWELAGFCLFFLFLGTYSFFHISFQSVVWEFCEVVEIFEVSQNSLRVEEEDLMAG